MNTETLSFIPQRPPFVMIGELVSADEATTKTTFRIDADNLFVNNGCFSESGMIENMAQTAAAGTGYKIRKAGLPAAVGYIAALKNVNIFALPKVNDTLTTEVTFLQTLLSFHLVKGAVMLNGEVIAECEFKIFVNPDQTIE
jgi:predicted hotdog family 3-hydroxylacyl-ACP dehydratase